jgi:hypothetical protein
VPQYNQTQDQYVQEIVATELNLLASHIGGHVGQAVGDLQKQINLLAGLDASAVTTLQAQVLALRNLLDGDVNTPGYQAFQNLLDLLDRVAAIETAQVATDAQLVNLTDGLSNVDDRLTILEGQTTQQLADIAADVATATATANSAQSSANAANAAIAVLSDREDNRHNQHEGRHTGHDNAIGKLRQQVFLSHVGLAAVTIAGFNGAFATSKAAALL